MSATCGAKTRSGNPCKSIIISSNGRCRMHGGKSTGPSLGTTNAKTHGIYERQLSDQERKDYAEVKIGSVDEELRLHKVRLSRALDAESKAANMPELEEINESDSGETRKHKVKDYTAIIDKLTARIESLEKTRLTLANGSEESKEHKSLNITITKAEDLFK